MDIQDEEKVLEVARNIEQRRAREKRVAEAKVEVDRALGVLRRGTFRRAHIIVVDNQNSATWVNIEEDNLEEVLKAVR